MSSEMYIGGPMPYVVEHGGGGVYKMSEVAHRLNFDPEGSKFGPNCWYDPVGRVIGPRLDYTPVDENKDRWTLLSDPDDFIETEFPRDENNKKVIQYIGDPPTTWTAILDEAFETGEGMVFFFHTFGTELQLAFGNGWVLEMLDQFPVSLKYLGAHVATGPDMDFARRDNYFYIYNVGPWLRVIWNREYQSGFAFHIENVAFPRKKDGRDYALGNGLAAIQSNGISWFAIRKLTWENSFGFELPSLTPLWTQSSQAASTYSWGWDHANTAVSVNAINEHGAPFIFGSAFRWRVTVANTADPEDIKRHETAFISRVGVDIPRVLGTAAGTAVDVNLPIGGPPGPHPDQWPRVDEVEVSMGLGLNSHTMTFRVTDDHGLETYLKHGLAVDWVEDGTTLFTGLITGLELEDQGPGASGNQVETMRVTVSAADILFAGSPLNFRDQRGQTLEQALLECFDAAGIPAADVDTTATALDVTLPTGTEQPLIPRPTDTPGSFAEYLLETYLPSYQIQPGIDFTFGVVPRDDTVSSTLVLGETLPLTTEDGSLELPVEEFMDNSNYANVVLVAGQDDIGNVLTGFAINWEDILTQAPYRIRMLAIIDAGLRTQEDVNLTTINIFNRVSQPIIGAKWKGNVIQGVTPGRRMQLGTLGTFRITKLKIIPEGGSLSDITTWRAEYEGIKVA